MSPGWLGDRRRHWLGSRPAPSSVPRKDAPAVKPDATAEVAYGVSYLPVRCPKCRRGDRVRTYSTRKTTSPPTRYHTCDRCQLNFRSHEVEETPDGRLKPRR